MATSVRDDTVHVHDLLHSENDNVISPEDLAWADSCLVDDPNIEDIDWTPFKEALSDALGSKGDSSSCVELPVDQPRRVKTEVPSFSQGTGNSHVNLDKAFHDMGLVDDTLEKKSGDHYLVDDNGGGFYSGLNMEVTSFSQGIGNSHIHLDKASDDVVMVDDAMEKKSDDHPLFDERRDAYLSRLNPNVTSFRQARGSSHNNRDKSYGDVALVKDTLEKQTYDLKLDKKKGDDFLSRFDIENVFLPTYNEDQRFIDAFVSEEDFGFPGFITDESTDGLYKVEGSTDDIFKLWDLNVPDEDGELMKQLKKALRQNAGAVSDDSGLGIDAYKSLNDLISSIADLSIEQSSV